jgi:transcriptional regulator with XRE-family HTH domain
MNITVNDELLAYIDPLTPEEHAALERSILAEGCRDALVLWGDVLVDGHNRYGICTKHNIPFNTVQNTRFKTMDDVHLWMIDQHLGRRSVSDFQRGVLALRKKDILAGRDQPAPAEAVADTSGPAPWEAPAEAPAAPAAEPALTREALAKAARVSSATISQIEKIQKSATPELVAAVKSGTISINTAATVASLPAEVQLAAAAGGKKELQQAARQVRAAKAVERTEPDTPEGIIARLKQTVAELTAENAALKAHIAELMA